MARRARLPGDPAEVIASIPPLNSFPSIVLFEILLVSSVKISDRTECHGSSG
jgi:hypothetical protein